MLDILNKTTITSLSRRSDDSLSSTNRTRMLPVLAAFLLLLLYVI